MLKLLLLFSILLFKEFSIAYSLKELLLILIPLKLSSILFSSCEYESLFIKISISFFSSGEQKEILSLIESFKYSI